MRLVIVSNRLPFTVTTSSEGRLNFQPSSGGLTSGVAAYLARAVDDSGKRPDCLWVGWPGATIAKEHEQAVKDYRAAACEVLPVFLPEESMERFYHGFCNNTLWPLFHYFPSLARYEEDYWQEYLQVNRVFAERLLEILQPDDTVWVHDYQLMLLPRLLRERFPALSIGFFLHIPFPSFEVFRLLPSEWRRELIEGVLGASLVGFHTHDYTRHFLSCVLRTSGYEHQLGSLALPERTVKVDTFPMGVDFDAFSRAASSVETETRVSELRAGCQGQKVIFSVDRLDYTKGLIDRLRGYDLFLKQHPEWHGKVTFILSVAPSRIGVETYRAMREELEQTVGRIIGRHGNVKWTPLIYQYCNLGFQELVALYRFCDVALITPLRDGMNLVAKEFIASRPDQTGVLILSEMAGAAKELGEALILNPFHKEEFSDALAKALTMPRQEQVRRNKVLQERLRRYDINRWASEFLQGLAATQKAAAARRARSLSGRALGSLTQRFDAAGKRALLLDYDGTLVPFNDLPDRASPDPDLLELLERLSSDSANEVVIISGRQRSDLEKWFGHLPLGLIAEHGVWLRSRGADWRPIKLMSADWKESVRPILQLYVDRLPGALLEEKEFSLAFHFRRAEPEQAFIRARELLDDLADYTRNIDVQVLEGDKVLEIRRTNVTKGTAALDWLAIHEPDFVLAIGDDWTDEDIFRALPPEAFTVRVGLARTAAAYHLGNHTAVRRLLFELGQFQRNSYSSRSPNGAALRTPLLDLLADTARRAINSIL
jgi:trehalose 6-phosphate synthase/phosphatase